VVKKSHPPSTALATKPTGNSYVDPAIKYLRMWKSARLSWTFQKVRQVWLLRNWRDRLKMSDEDFVIFLSYIVDLKGLSRTKTSDEAKAVRDEYESSETYGADDELKQKLYDRAGKIVEVLLPI
jgi:WKF domain